jgi:hypothetical protein
MFVVRSTTRHGVSDVEGSGGTPSDTQVTSSRPAMDTAAYRTSLASAWAIGPELYGGGIDSGVNATT